MRAARIIGSSVRWSRVQRRVIHLTWSGTCQVIDVDVFDPRARLPVSTLLAGSAPVRLVDVREDRAEPDGRRGDVAAAGYEEVNFGDVAPYRAEEPQGAERAEDGSVRRVVEQASQAPRREQNRIGSGRGLHESGPVRRREERAARDQEAIERVSGDRCGLVVAAAVPVDLAATARERPSCIAIVWRPQGSPIRIDRALNRGCRWSGRLEHKRLDNVLW